MITYLFYKLKMILQLLSIIHNLINNKFGFEVTFII